MATTWEVPFVCVLMVTILYRFIFVSVITVVEPIKKAQDAYVRALYPDDSYDIKSLIESFNKSGLTALPTPPPFRAPEEASVEISFSFSKNRTAEDMPWREFETDEFIGLFVLLGIELVVMILYVIEFILALVFVYFYDKEVQYLNYWIIARMCCFFLNFNGIALYCTAIIMLEPFPQQWLLYGGLVFCIIVTSAGIFTAVMAIQKVKKIN